MERDPLGQRWYDPAKMAVRGRLGALVAHAHNDSRQLTAKARDAFLLRFEREVDPEGALPEAERRRRAKLARRAYFTRLALISARKRAKQATKTATGRKPVAAVEGCDVSAQPPR